MVLVPAGVVTTTSTVPVPVPAGLTTWAWESLSTFSPVPGDPPKVTAVAPVNPLPVTVTVVPPAAGPPIGLIAVTAGAGGASLSTRMLSRPQLSPSVCRPTPENTKPTLAD